MDWLEMYENGQVTEDEAGHALIQHIWRYLIQTGRDNCDNEALLAGASAQIPIAE